ncbi:hypothetical protein [Companilactobacillus kimchii]|uniref:DUF4649 domain-containing protein n=2 Tax=Companilactobacillus kimchii TaxID=2801452 RepID=A0ABR5NTN9_9LACO|nr:hypothetical protein [Companilactobacillus kimchii]KAE9558635.1 hypothetical protein ATN91_13605 [Companilactobacillus kimchii]KRK51764.1 hypothetical protein FC97_GL000557 [Companilactobacillus kimchii DSM 13961 = JCM 10707]OWF33949.1 hypothetical protein LKACC12383_00559 [Companilactobacillus kimchii]GEO47141.1 hypothetical protein LKI01_11400 [Companilactobacillus paralimentarius]
MLKITYLDSGIEKTKEYKNGDQFVAIQQLEVPDFEDYVKIVQATEDNQKLPLKDSTMYGLYNYLINK